MVKSFLEVIILILAVIVLLVLSSLAGAVFQETGFDNWLLQQKAWVRTENSLSWPKVGFAEAKLGEYNWSDYTLGIIINPEEYGENGQVRLYFRQASPFYTYSLNITPDFISLSRFGGHHENSKKLVTADIGIKAGVEAKIGLIAKGSEFSVFLNDELILKTEDRRYPYGGISLWAENSKFTAKDFTITGIADKEYVVNEGYYPKEDPCSGGINDLMLIYNNYGKSWTLENALNYVTYRVPDENNSLVIKDWFFDSFLFLSLVGPKKHAFDSPARATPATMKEWQWYIDTIFIKDKQIAAFDKAYDLANQTLSKKRRGKIYIMIPNPMVEVKDFGDVDGSGSLNFSLKDPTLAVEERFKAVKWYVDQVLERYNAAEFKNLDLIGFYWVEETIHFNNPGETGLVKQVSDYLHAKNLKLSWIPFYNAEGNREWDKLGFDLCIYQPNHVFDNYSTNSRFIDVCKTAREIEMGIEIEVDKRILKNDTQRDKFINYLRAGVTLGYMKEAVHGYYQDVNFLEQCALSDDPKIRELYDLVYLFVKEEFDEPLGTK